MKLKRIKIAKYKNLQNCEIQFPSNGLTVIAGVNGSGKSNLLETMALIVQDLNGVELLPPVECPLYEFEYQHFDRQYVAKRVQKSDVAPTWAFGDDTIDVEPNPPNRVIVMYSGQFCRREAFGASIGGRSSALIDFVDSSSLNVALLTLALAGLSNDVDCIVFDLLGGSFQDEDVRVVGILEELRRIAGSGMTSLSLSISDLKGIFVKAGVAENAADVFRVLESLMADYGSRRMRIVDPDIYLKVDGKQFAADQLSEGEKRLLLIRFIYEALADSESIVLMDEPDAHLHEFRKAELLDLVSVHAKNGVSTILTTHSPALIEYALDESIVALKLDEVGEVSAYQGIEFDVIKDLTGSKLSFFSTRPIALFEGKSDINLLLNAASALKRNNPTKYSSLALDKTFDFYFFGGTGNALEALDMFRDKFPARKLLLVLDGDEAGRKSLKNIKKAKNLLDTSLKEDQNNKSKVLMIDSLTYALIPPSPVNVASDFMIEDYVDKNFLNRRIADYLSDQQYRSYSSLKAIRKELKEELGECKPMHKPKDSEYAGFERIVDFLIGLL